MQVILIKFYKDYAEPVALMKDLGVYKYFVFEYSHYFYELHIFYVLGVQI